MATGVSGYIDFAATKGFTLRVHYSETYDNASNTSSVAITKLQVAGSQYWGASHYPDGTIQINGITAVTMSANQGTHHVSLDGQNTFYDVSGTLGSVTGIVHADDGSKNISISVSVTGHTLDGTNGTGWTVTSSSTVTLTTISVGYIYIDNGSGFDAYQCYIDNGSSWERYIPYIDNGSSWDKCG